MMKVVAVPAAEASDWRERLGWHFDEFTKNPSITKERLWADVETKERQLFVVEGEDIKVVVLTRIADDDLQSCVVTHAAGYDRASWQHLWQALENWAQSIGCKRIEAIARPGWERPLAAFGMKKTHVMLEKAL